MNLIYIANIRLPTEKAHGAQIMKTCEAFARAGAQVELVVPRRHTDITEEPFAYYGVKENFSITYLPVLDLIWLGRIGFWLESLSFSFFVVFNMVNARGIIYSRDDLPACMLSFFQKNIVWESHGGRYNFLVRRLLRVCKGIVVISEGLKDFYLKKAPHTTIIVAPDGIDLAAFAHPESKEAARTRLGLPQDKKIVLYIGRLDGWKGTQTLFDAAEKLPNDCIVVIIGGEEDQVTKFRRLYPSIVFLGFHPYRELADNQAAADVLILPNTGKDETSARFTSPLKLFSYMASGKSIVTSDLPSIREILTPESAFFFEADNADSLAQAITLALVDPARAQAVADRAHREVVRYTWDTRAHSILSFLTPLS